MPRSLANGDYSLVMAIESSSRSGSWYRVLADRQTGLFSCDCPPYLFKQGQQAGGAQRSCPHTLFGALLAGQTSPTPHPSTRRAGPVMERVSPADLLGAIQQQWPGLRGQWSLDGRRAEINGKPYQILLVRLSMGNGGTATGVVAFAEAH